MKWIQHKPTGLDNGISAPIYYLGRKVLCSEQVIQLCIVAWHCQTLTSNPADVRSAGFLSRLHGQHTFTFGDIFIIQDNTLIQNGNSIQLGRLSEGHSPENMKLQCGNWTRGTKLKTQDGWWIPDRRAQFQLHLWGICDPVWAGIELSILQPMLVTTGPPWECNNNSVPSPESSTNRHGKPSPCALARSHDQPSQGG